MFEADGELLQIFVKTPGGTTITMTLGRSRVVRNIKAVIQARLYHPTKVQRLTYEGKQLEDGMTLGHYNIQNDSTLYLEVETKKEKKPFVGLEGAKMLPTSASSSTAQLNLNIWFLRFAYFCLFSLQTVVV